MSNTFRCSDCNRHLPQFMQATKEQCQDCFEKPKQSADSNRLSIDSPGENPSVQLYYRPTVPDGFPHLTSCYIFGLGVYRSKTKGRTRFSTEVIDFAKDGNLEKFYYFAPHLDYFFKNRVGEMIHPDIITVYPSHSGKYSEALVKACEEIETDHEIRYQELLTRTEARPQQKKYHRSKERWENQDGSISAKRTLSGEVVIILDDVTTSGASVTVGKNELMNTGASQVIGLCLAISKRSQDIYHRISRSKKTVGSVISDG